MNRTIETVIPKVVHYCWFGGKRKPKLVRECIKSWKKLLPEYKIIEWNEKNSDLSHPFVKKMYSLKKWAFVSDYVRFKVLVEFGGLYLDTDMMLLKTINPLLTNSCFFGAETNNIVSCGIIGAIKNHDFIKSCLDSYQTLKIEDKIIWDDLVITLRVTEMFRLKYNFSGFFDKQIALNNITIFPVDCFYPLPLEEKNCVSNYKIYVKENSYTVHLWSGSWIVYNEFEFLRKGEYCRGIKIICNQFTLAHLNFKYFRKILSSIKESLSK